MLPSLWELGKNTANLSGPVFIVRINHKLEAEHLASNYLFQLITVSSLFKILNSDNNTRLHLTQLMLQRQLIPLQIELELLPANS